MTTTVAEVPNGERVEERTVASFSPGQAGYAADHGEQAESSDGQASAVFTPGEGHAAPDGVDRPGSVHAQPTADSSPGGAQFSAGPGSAAHPTSTTPFFEALTGVPFDGQIFSAPLADVMSAESDVPSAPAVTSPFLQPPDQGSDTPRGNSGG